MARRRRAPVNRDIKWNFISFPVLFGFCFGIFIAAILAPVLLLPVFYVGLFGVAFCTAHVISQWWQKRGLDRRLQRDEEAERERRALASRSAAALQGESESQQRRRRRRRGIGGGA